MSMDEIGDHVEHCKSCSREAGRIFEVGMIRVDDGTSPTRFSDGSYKDVPMSHDPGFQKEFNTIFEGEGGIDNPVTGERYEVFDDEGGDGPYMAPPDDRAAHKAGHEEAQKRHTVPTKKEQDRWRHRFHDSQLALAKKRKKGKLPPIEKKE